MAAAAAATPDYLFNLRNLFYLGAYGAAINSSDLPNLSPDEAIERDSLVYRSYIALGSHQLVINEIDSSAATPLQAESAITSLKEWLADPAIGNNPILRLVAGTIFLYEQDYNEALKHTNVGGTMELSGVILDVANQRTIWLEWVLQSALSQILDIGFYELTLGRYIDYPKHEHAEADGRKALIKRWQFLKPNYYCSYFCSHALNVQIFLKMNRSDYAEKQLRAMQQLDEDHTLTQLASAWFNLAVGGSKIQESYLIFQDLSEKYQMTSLIANGKAVCCIHMGNFDEAETLLLEAQSKDAKDPETLANLIVCALHLGKPTSRLLSQLKLSHPDHILVKRASSAEESFDRAIQSVA
ncbi:Coatomer, epsilon subunit [Parasponia andersonii]|uniref:Coatomer, epsilon subunit n=1 Tax=Parasponia andersonii TaxID=3476 RepID=A0A2P5CRI1_PARAD|nr:Coatomer, epsilon subunit [Parasponia andersonii]